jgi:molybdopterin-guanine dinucleotide biosynthesis protein A
MPHILPGILELLLDAADLRADAVVPRPGGRPEALLAVYGRGALPAIERSIAAGRLKVMAALEGLRVRFLDESELASVDPERCSFANVNTPADLAAARAFAGKERP